MHANFIVHNGQGMAKDVLSLINEISEKVLLETGYKMEVEVIYVTPNGVFYQLIKPILSKIYVFC